MLLLLSILHCCIADTLQPPTTKPELPSGPATVLVVVRPVPVPVLARRSTLPPPYRVPLQQGGKRRRYVLIGALIGGTAGALWQDECTDCIAINPVKVGGGILVGALVGAFMSPT